MGFQLLISQMDESNDHDLIPHLLETMSHLTKNGLSFPEKSLSLVLHFASRLLQISLENISHEHKFSDAEKAISQWILTNTRRIQEVLNINRLVFAEEEAQSDELDPIDTFSVTAVLLASGKVFEI